MKELVVGDIKGVPGEIKYGFLDVLEHPVGTIERLPVIIAQGHNDGPVLWLTANIHGDEYTGIPVIHKTIEKLDLKKLNGAIVAIPSLNPAGSRVTSRCPYYDQKDPNRLFPDGNPFKKKSKSETQIDVTLPKEEHIAISVDEDDKEKSADPLAIYEEDELYPSVQEMIWKRLFNIIKDSADVLIDFHNAYIKSIPFIFLDRVLYDPTKTKDAIAEAENLYIRTEKIANAFGFTIVRESTPKKYTSKKLHRSTSGAALNSLRIPSFTVELGMYRDVEPEVIDAAVKGISNVMKQTGMIGGKKEPITEVKVVGNGKAIRHIGHPRIKTSAVIELLVKKGDFVKKGDTIAIARDIFGRKLLKEHELKSEVDGYVFMINEGIMRYPNEVLCWIAAEDVNPMVDKWPKKQ